MSVTGSDVALSIFPWIPKFRTTNNQFIVDIPGIAREEDGKIRSVWLQVYGFEPYYYFELHEGVPWVQGMAEAVFQQLQYMFPNCAPTSGNLVWKHPFQLYRPNYKMPLLEMTFSSVVHMFTIRKRLQGDEQMRAMLGLTGNVLEVDIDPMLKMFTKLEMSFSQWFTCNGRPVPQDDWVSFGGENHQEYSVHWKSLRKIELEKCSQWVVEPEIMSFDIEAFSTDALRMPCPYLVEEAAYLNVCTFQKLGHPSTKHREVITLLPVDDVTGAEIHFCPTEVECCNKMVELIQKYQPDIIIGYNIAGFDMEYLHRRRGVFERNIRWPTMGRMLYEDHSDLDPIHWSSSGAGDVHGNHFKMTGRMIFDIYYYIARFFKLAEYNLSFVSRTFLKEDKHPIKPQDQFIIYKDYRNALQVLVEVTKVGGALDPLQAAELVRAKDEYRKLVQYCIQDAELVMKLFEYHNIFTNLRARSKVFSVPVNYIIEKGETIKITSMLYSVAYGMGYVLTTVEKADYDYEGGLVQKPIPGYHKWIVCGDFSSMYPTIMISLNACPTTLVPDWVLIRKLVVVEGRSIPESNADMVERWNSIHATAKMVPNPKYKEKKKARKRKGQPSAPQQEQEVEEPQFILQPAKYAAVKAEDVPKLEVLSIDDVNEEIVPPKKGTEPTYVYFVKPHLRKGVAPTKANDLLKERGGYKTILKKWMDKSGNLIPPKHNRQELAQCEEADCMQNSLKIGVNAEYGFFGASFNKRACIQVAMAITAGGRRLANFCTSHVIKKYGAEIVYGDTDSIMFKIPGIKEGKDCHVLGRKIMKELTDMFPPPLAIAYEKSMNIFLLRKKHYVFLPLGDDGLPIEKKLSARGVIIARRDYCGWVQDAYKELIMMILHGAPLMKCLEVVARELHRLFKGEVPLEKLALIKKYTSRAGDDYYIPRFVARKRRPPSNRTIQIGERVKYIYICAPKRQMRTDKGKIKMVDPTGEEKMEMFDEWDPSRMQLDLMHYLEHQFITPIDNLVGTAYVKDFTAPGVKEMAYKPTTNTKKHPVYYWHFDKKDQCERGNPVKVMRAMVEDNVDPAWIMELIANPPPPKPKLDGQNTILLA